MPDDFRDAVSEMAGGYARGEQPHRLEIVDGEAAPESSSQVVGQALEQCLAVRSSCLPSLFKLHDATADAVMVRFAEAFPDDGIVSALRRQLGWTHFKRIMYIDDALKRDFYAEMCRVERWSTRTLDQKIGGMLYERTALSKKPAKLVRQEIDALRHGGKLTPDLVFRDPSGTRTSWASSV